MGGDPNNKIRASKHRGIYFMGMRQGKKQNLVGSSGFKETFCHMK
jgi:hypothetical protein